MTHAVSPKRTRPLPVLCAFLSSIAFLTGCSPGAPPEQTAEDLAEVQQEPPPPEAAEDLDVDTEPHPVIEPLECTPYLVITARGTGEPRKRQLLSPVARLISEARPGQTQIVDLDYPANGEIQEGASTGVRTLIDTLNQQAELCPGQQTFLLGYSQGALVVGETLIEAEARLVGAAAGELSAAAAENIGAVVLYADPRFVAADPFNAGDFHPSVNGLLERQPGALDAYANRARSYCVAHDIICQNSSELNDEGHVAYYANGMQQDGAAFAITRMDAPFSE